MNLICFSWEVFDLNARKRSVPLLLALQRFSGFPRALYVNSPLHLSAMIRGAYPAYRKVTYRSLWPRKVAGFCVFTPFYPFPYRFGRLNTLFARMELAVLKTLLRIRPYIYLNVNPQVTQLQPAFADAQINILDMYDDFEQVLSPGEGDNEQAQIHEAVDAAARRADCLIAVNAPLAKRFKEICARVAVLRNAVEHDMFADGHRTAQPPVELQKLPRPIIGYMGATNNRADFDLIKYLVAQRPQWSFVFLGNIDSSAAIPPELRSAANVRFLAAVPCDELPRYLTHFNVGIVPFLVNPMCQGLDTLKTYHYLAAGLPVVTTAVGGTDVFGGLVKIATSPRDFLEKIEAALDGDPANERGRRIQYARENSWDSRAVEFKKLIDSVPLSQ